MRLAGNVAIVTGAAQGIGRTYAERFAAEGARVVIVDLRHAQAEETASAIRAAGGAAEALEADVSDEEAMNHVAATVLARHGRIDTLLNNAALYGDLDFRDQSIAYLERVFRVNVFGILIASRAVFPQMRQQGSGSIINIASTAAYEFVTEDRLQRDLQSIPNFSYSLSKAGVISLTKFMAGAIGKYGIRVNCICPGMTMSETTKRLLPAELIESHRRAAAMQSTLEPEDIAGTAVYLASPDSRLVTGQTILVDAGFVMPG